MVTGYFPKHIGTVFLYLNIDFVFANSAKTGKLPLSKVVLYSRVLNHTAQTKTRLLLQSDQGLPCTTDCLCKQLGILGECADGRLVLVFAAGLCYKY